MRHLDQQSQEGEDQARAGDYFVVSGEFSTWLVSTAMARHIERSLDRRPRRRWITFVDLSGSRIRMRGRDVQYIAQSTAEQRAADRAFLRKLNQERKADRSYEDDD